MSWRAFCAACHGYAASCRRSSSIPRSRSTWPALTRAPAKAWLVGEGPRVDSAKVHRRALAASPAAHTPPGGTNVPPGHPRIICSYIRV